MTTRILVTGDGERLLEVSRPHVVIHLAAKDLRKFAQLGSGEEISMETLAEGLRKTLDWCLTSRTPA